jgi:DNA polymerase III alpha subunit
MSADVDIDFSNKFDPTIFGWTRASVVKNGELTPHPCGYYPQSIPVDDVTKLSAIPYEAAEEVGFMKIDFLHVNVYNHFKSRDEILELLEIEPDWTQMMNPRVQAKLFQLSKHGDVIDLLKPKSILEVADILALIRPGKRGLIKVYKENPEAVRNLLYRKGKDGYTFKKSHAIAYAMIIVLQLHLIEAGVI